MRHWQKRIMWTVGAFAGVLILLPLALYFGANTLLGRRAIEALMPTFTGGTVSLEGLSGHFPDTLHAVRVTLNDEGGTWAVIDNASIDWSPSALLNSDIRVSLLDSSHIALVRLPKEKAKNDHSELPVHIYVKALHVARLDIGPALAGRTFALTLAGHLNYFSSHRIETQLMAHPLGGAGQYRIAASIDSAHIDAAVHLHEPLHGLIAGLAGLPDIGPVELDATASGRRADEKVSVALTAGSLQGRGAGYADLVSHTGKMDFAVYAPAMMPRPDVSWQSIALEGHASGAFSSPLVHGHMLLAGLRAGVATLERLSGEVEGHAGSVRFTAQAKGLHVLGQHPDLLTGAPIDINAQAKLGGAAPHATFSLSHKLALVLGDADFGANQKVSLSVDVPSLAPFAGLAGVELPGRGSATAKLSTNGQTTGLTLEGTFGLTGVSLPARLFGQSGKLAMTATAANGDVRVTDLSISGAAIAASAHGTWRDTTLDAGWNVKLGDVSRFLRTLSGAVVLQGTANGKADDFAITATGQGSVASRGFEKSPLSFALEAQHLPRAPAGDLHAEGRFDKAPLRVLATASRLTNGGLAIAVRNADWKSVNARADLVLAKGARLPVGHAVFHLDKLADIGAVLGEPLAGRLDGTLDLAAKNGRIAAKFDAIGANLVVRGANAAKFALAGEIADPLRSPVGAFRLTLANAAFGNAEASITAAVGLMQKNGRTDAAIDATAETIRAQSASVARLAVTGEIADPLKAPVAALKIAASGVKANGISGQFDSAVNGPLRALALEVSGDGQARDGHNAQFSGNALLNIPAKYLTVGIFHATYRGEAVHLAQPSHIDFADGLVIDRLRMAIGHATLDVAGRVAPRLDVTASVENLTADLVDLVAPQVVASGSASINARLVGTLDAPEGNATISASGIQFYASARGMPPASIAATAALRAGSATVAATVEAGRNIQLTLDGKAPLQANASLAMHAKGSIDLAVLDPILNAKGRSLHGELTLDGTASGTPAEPLFSGKARLANGEIQDFVQGVHLRDVAAVLDGNGGTLAIRQMSARAGGGTISGSGTIDLRSPGFPVNLTIVANKASPIATDQLNAVLDANLKVTGHAQGDLALSGAVTIARGEFDIPDTYPPGVAVLDVHRRGHAAPPPPQPTMQIGLNLSVSSSGRLFVRGRGLDAEMSGTLHVGGSSSAPLVTGGFDMRRGTLNLASQTLDFTSGRVSFDGTSVHKGIDPAIDFVAQSSTSSVSATLEVTGYVSRPQIKLSSTPALPQDEVLSQLLFQQSVTKLSPLQLAEIAQALASLTGIGSGGFNPLVSARKTLGLDRLTVGNSDTGNGATLEAGKYVANGIYVGAKQDTAGGTQGQVQVDLTKHLKLLTTLSTQQTSPSTTTGVATTNDTGSSIGLSYQFEY